MKIKKPPIAELRKIQTKLLELYPELGSDEFILYRNLLYPFYENRNKPMYGFNITISSRESNFEALCKHFNNICEVIKEFLIQWYPEKIFYYKDKNIVDNSDKISDINGCSIEYELPKEHDIREDGEIIWRYGAIYITDLVWTPNKIKGLK